MNRRRLPRIALLAFLPTLAAAAPPADPVRESDIAATVRFLASPELEGRGAADRGGAVAAAYLASRLEAIGFLPAGDPGPEGPSFFQEISGVEARLDRPGSWIERRAAGAAPRRFAGDSGSFLVLPDRAETVEVRGEAVFAGFGIRAPEHSHDDYAGLPVAGKIVIAFSGEPGETDPASRWSGARSTRHATTAAKAALAGSLGAAALLIVPNPAGKAPTAVELLRGKADEMSGPWLGLEGAAPPLPTVFLEPETALAILEGSGIDPRAPSADLEASRPAGRALAGLEIAVRLEVRDRRPVSLRNVVGRLGSGRGLDGEAVVIGAHFDHLGIAGGVLHPGANDNASGVSGLLAAASALAAAPPAGEREILVAFWTAEERGRLGSSWFAARPPVPKSRISAVVNLDVLGRSNLDRPEYSNAIQLIYSAAAPALRDLAARANEGAGFDLRFHPALRFQPVGDHYSFAEAGLPVVFAFSGYYDEYHGPGDTAEKIDVARVARTARLVARLARLLAERPEPIRLDPSIREAPRPDPFERPEH